MFFSISERRSPPVSILSAEGLYPQKKPNPEERNLAFAIILQALRDFFGRGSNGYNDEERLLWEKDAAEWFRSKENNPGSFVWCCDILAWNPIKARRFLMNKKNGLNLRKIIRRFQMRDF